MGSSATSDTELSSASGTSTDETAPSPDDESSPINVDALIIGAGIAGISAGYHLQKDCWNRSFVILERRANIGGTWDLFRYPGIRSDSEMYSLGFKFNPWREQKAIVDGPTIKNYVTETAAKFGIDKHIRFHRHVKHANWSSNDARWTFEVTNTKTGKTEIYRAKFAFFCSGYYSYDKGYTPDFPGIKKFHGQIIHPQFWPEDLDLTDKRIAVIGSGATAVSLIPELAENAAHVTMIQRTPTYMISLPTIDPLATSLKRVLPTKLRYFIVRWYNILFQLFFFGQARKKPEMVKVRLFRLLKKELPEDFDIETHFTPPYNPWEQRLCLVADSDFFRAIKSGKASMVTDHIETFTDTGIRLKSGNHLDADIIVTATGLKLQVLGGINLTIDGQTIDPSKLLIYKGAMFSDVPNLAFTFGYTNAAWTLKADLTSEFVCRLLNYMDDKKVDIAVPRLVDPDIQPQPMTDFSSGYFKRAEHILPKQGSKKPWRLNHDYPLDVKILRYGKINDGTLVFEKASSQSDHSENADDKLLQAAE